MSTRVDPDEIQITRSEKTLALVLAIFMLIGGLWVVYQPLDRTSDEYTPQVRKSPAESTALADLGAARDQLRRARSTERQARRTLELTREAYRTELDAGRPGNSREAAFRAAERRFSRSGTRVRGSQASVARVRPAAVRAQRSISNRQRAQDKKFEDRSNDRERDTFILRLAWTLWAMAMAFVLHARLRRRRSRYLTVGLAAIGFATAQAAVVAVDYITDYIDIAKAGPAVLSAAGIAMSLAAMVVLQRYLAQRLPARRVKRRECPVCAYPVGAEHRYCEGCGREVVADCANCGQRRRVGTMRCGACGAAA